MFLTFKWPYDHRTASCCVVAVQACGSVTISSQSCLLPSNTTRWYPTTSVLPLHFACFYGVVNALSWYPFGKSPVASGFSDPNSAQCDPERHVDRCWGVCTHYCHLMVCSVQFRASKVWSLKAYDFSLKACPLSEGNQWVRFFLVVVKTPGGT